MPSILTKLWRRIRGPCQKRGSNVTIDSPPSTTGPSRRKSILSHSDSVTLARRKVSKNILPKKQQSVTFDTGASTSCLVENSSQSVDTLTGYQAAPSDATLNVHTANNNNVTTSGGTRGSLMPLDERVVNPAPSPRSLRRCLSTALSVVELSMKSSTSGEALSQLAVRTSHSGIFSGLRRQAAVHPSSEERLNSIGSSSSFLWRRPSSQNKISLNDLPNELILEICAYLPRDSTFVALKCTSRRLSKLLEADCFIRSTSLKLRNIVKPKLLLNVLATSIHLRVLDVAGCLGITDRLLIYVVKNCRGITDIDVSGCMMVTDFGLEKMGRYLSRIERISLANLRQITSEGLMRLMTQHMNSLKALDISCCFRLEESSFRLEYIGEYCPNLEELSFRWSADSTSWITMWESRMSKFCELCPKLKYLDISCSPSRDVKGIVSTVADHCPNMESLVLSRCSVRDNSLLKLAKLTNLKYLDLSHSPDLCGVSIVFAIRQQPHLTRLDLSGCYKLTDEYMAPLLAALPHIRELQLRDCYDIGDESLSQVSASCPTLGFLDVSGTMLTEKGVQAILDQAGPHFLLVTENCPLLAQRYEHIWQTIPLVTLPTGGTSGLRYDE